ncbi:MAG: hypothetical protein ACI90V_011687 [Bacillariaceae sp.]|jgi:hypothetical protein
MNDLLFLYDAKRRATVIIVRMKKKAKIPKNQLQITLFASDRLPQFDKKKKTKFAFLRNGMRDGPVKA